MITIDLGGSEMLLEMYILTAQGGVSMLDVQTDKKWNYNISDNIMFVECSDPEEQFQFELTYGSSFTPIDFLKTVCEMPPKKEEDIE